MFRIVNDAVTNVYWKYIRLTFNYNQLIELHQKAFYKIRKQNNHVKVFNIIIMISIINIVRD